LFWVQNKLSPRRLALAALFAAIAVPAAADVLVVRSSGPSAGSYPPGRSLPDNARIALRGGDTLVVLDARGTRTFRGPGTFSPAQAAPTGTRTVAGANGRRARIGAVRSAGIVPASPTTIWHVDVAQGGTVCLAAGAEPMLWRADSTEAMELTVAGAGGASQTVQWPAGESTLAWPAGVAVSDDAEYRFSAAGMAVPQTIRVQLLGPVESDLSAVAQALIENDCSEQLDLLVETAPTDTASGG
jgi:hypothetical protein